MWYDEAGFFVFVPGTLLKPEFYFNVFIYGMRCFRQEVADRCGQLSGVVATVLVDVGSLLGVAASVWITGGCSTELLPWKTWRYGDVVGCYDVRW